MSSPLLSSSKSHRAVFEVSVAPAAIHTRIASSIFVSGGWQSRQSGAVINTASGFQALFSNAIGSANTAIGNTALFNNTGGSNIAVGAGAGYNLTSGNNNIDIGNDGVANDSALFVLARAELRPKRLSPVLASQELWVQRLK